MMIGRRISARPAPNPTRKPISRLRRAARRFRWKPEEVPQSRIRRPDWQKNDSKRVTTEPRFMEKTSYTGRLGSTLRTWRRIFGFKALAVRGFVIDDAEISPSLW